MSLKANYIYNIEGLFLNYYTFFSSLSSFLHFMGMHIVFSDCVPNSLSTIFRYIFFLNTVFLISTMEYNRLSHCNILSSVLKILCEKNKIKLNNRKKLLFDPCVLKGIIIFFVIVYWFHFFLLFSSFQTACCLWMFYHHSVILFELHTCLWPGVLSNFIQLDSKMCVFSYYLECALVRHSLWKKKK